MLHEYTRGRMAVRLHRYKTRLKQGWCNTWQQSSSRACALEFSEVYYVGRIAEHKPKASEHQQPNPLIFWNIRAWQRSAFPRNWKHGNNWAFWAVIPNYEADKSGLSVAINVLIITKAANWEVLLRPLLRKTTKTRKGQMGSTTRVSLFHFVQHSQLSINNALWCIFQVARITQIYPDLCHQIKLLTV